MARIKKQNGNGKDSENFDVEKAFEEEISKPYYKVDYLDSFKLPYEKLDVSVVIPTYNRCPYKPNSLRGELNPLAWALQSLLLQKPIVKEIIIVDDHSTDYTKDVVESFRRKTKEKKIKLVYLRNKRHIGYGNTVNVGTANANSKYLFFVDDDSIVAPYAAFGAVCTFEWLKSTGVNIGIINLPPYLRSSNPENIKPISQISQIDFYNGLYYSNKASFPVEYLNNENKFIHSEFHILKPFIIQNSGGYILCSKDLFTKIGGFPTTNYERFWEREFGCMAIDNGYSIYFQPDPKFHCVHGSYGLKTGKEFTGEDWFKKIGGQISLKKAMKECDRPLKNTGCRVPLKEYFYHSMAAIFSILFPRNDRGALKWIKKVYQEFVIDGDPTILNTTLIEELTLKERKELWSKALTESLSFIKKREKLKMKKLEELIKKLQKEEIVKKILDILDNQKIYRLFL
jgi:glycosyltransferase involved in cell wall biosynthesis